MKSHALALGCLFVSLFFLSSCAWLGSSATAQHRPSPTPSSWVPSPISANLAVSPTATSSTCNPALQWKPPSDNIRLNDMAMVSPTEGWAIGNTTSSAAPASEVGVIYHYVNGHWVGLPETFPNASLVGLSMDSPTDGWAVSMPRDQNPGVRPLTLHYTGGQWRPVDVPALDAILHSGGSIQSISVHMFAPSSGWIIAWTFLPPAPRPAGAGSAYVILHLENGIWTPIALPRVNVSDEGDEVFSPASADELWMMGSNNRYGNDSLAFFAHYKDGRWSLWPQTFPGGDIAVFDMLSPTDGWASHYGRGQWELLHFDGSTWAPIALPTQSDLYPPIVLASVIVAVNAGTTWFGTIDLDRLDAGAGPLIEQYANGKWQQVSWPFLTVHPGTIVATSSGDLWGVGGIVHQEGCGPALPALVRAIVQGVFLRLHQGRWTTQVLP